MLAGFAARIAALLPVLMLASLLAMPARAGMFDDEEARMGCCC